MSDSFCNYSWLSPDLEFPCESSVHAHSTEEKAHLFQAMDGASTELEVLNWLNATIRMLKCENILETGSYVGIGTVAMASACRSNGFGMVHSLELNPESCSLARRLIENAGLSDFATVHQVYTLDWLRSNKIVFDMGFFDSDCACRAEEFGICLDLKTIRGMAVFHDTSPLRCKTFPDPPAFVHDYYRDKLRIFADDPRCAGWFESPLSRGLTCLFVRKSIVERKDGLRDGG